MLTGGLGAWPDDSYYDPQRPWWLPYFFDTPTESALKYGKAAMYVLPASMVPYGDVISTWGKEPPPLTKPSGKPPDYTPAVPSDLFTPDLEQLRQADFEKYQRVTREAITDVEWPDAEKGNLWLLPLLLVVGGVVIYKVVIK